MAYAAVIVMPCQARVASAAAATPLVNQAEKRAVIEEAGVLLTANYIFPDRAADAKTKIDAALAGGAYDFTKAPEVFAEKLTSDLQSVTHDKHLRVFPPPAPEPAAGATSTAEQKAQRVYAGFSRVDRLKGNIGYIKLLNFPDSAGPFSQTANQAMTDLAGTTALIIDMRDNGGGSPDGIAYLCSFFFDPETPVHINGFVIRKSGTNELSTEEFYTRPVPVSYLGKPVYLLTSKRTFSGGEEFLYDLQTQKRARLIGEVTGGGANPGIIRPLPSGFTIFIPGGRAVNPITKTNWEGTGVKPDREVGETMALQTAMREIVASNPAKYKALKSDIESQSTEDGFVEARLLRFRSQPLAGGEAAVRSLFSGMASGKPDYALMSDAIATRINNGLKLYHADMSKAGEVKSVMFTGVGPDGLDNYELKTAAFTVHFAIYLGTDGEIVATNFGPPQPLPSQR